MRRTIGEWQGIVHERNVEKGFYDYRTDVRVLEGVLADDGLTAEEKMALSRVLTDYLAAMRERKLLLVIGELCEAHEELRAGHRPGDVYTETIAGKVLHPNPDSLDGTQKPEGYLIEMADAAIHL